MPITVPVVQATVTLLDELTRGRRGLSIGAYRPHIVMGPQTQRVAIRDGNRFTENYLGVMFVGGPDTLARIIREGIVSAQSLVQGGL